MDFCLPAAEVPGRQACCIAPPACKCTCMRQRCRQSQQGSACLVLLLGLSLLHASVQPPGMCADVRCQATPRPLVRDMPFRPPRASLSSGQAKATGQPKATGPRAAPAPVPYGVADELADAPLAGPQLAAVVDPPLWEDVQPVTHGHSAGCSSHDGLMEAPAPLDGQRLAIEEKLPEGQGMSLSVLAVCHLQHQAAIPQHVATQGDLPAGRACFLGLCCGYTGHRRPQPRSVGSDLPSERVAQRQGPPLLG